MSKGRNSEHLAAMVTLGEDSWRNGLAEGFAVALRIAEWSKDAADAVAGIRAEAMRRVPEPFQLELQKRTAP